MEPTPLPPELSGGLAVAVEDSPVARQALRWAAALAVGLDRPLHVVSVWNLVSGQGPTDRLPDESPTLARWQQAAEQRLADLVREELAAVGGAPVVHQVVLHGSTVPTLLRVSEVVDHLVVGARGRGGFTGLLLGSTSDQLVRYASCPVTVVGRGDAR